MTSEIESERMRLIDERETTRRTTTALSLALMLVLPGCGGGGGDKAVTVDGSSTVFRISKAAQEEFARRKPGLDVIVSNHGTSGGFGAYLRGKVNIVDASRTAKAEEESQAKSKNLEWTRFLVGYDGITVVVNPKNDFVKFLTVEQLKRLWEPGSKVKTWKDLDPSWPDRKINFYCPDNDSGTFDFFTEAIVGKARQRQDTQASPDDNTLVVGVSGDEDGIGYFGYAYFAANSKKLRALPIQAAGKDAPVSPSLDTILHKSYEPLSRPLYIYVKNSAAKRTEVVDFVTFYLDEIESLSKAGGYVPPTEGDRAANREGLVKFKAAGKS